LFLNNDLLDKVTTISDIHGHTKRLTMLTMTIKSPVAKIKGLHINTSVANPNPNPKTWP